MRDLSRVFQPGCRYRIFSGGGEVDRAHAMLFPKAPNICHFVFPEAPHGLTLELKSRGVLYPVVAAGFSHSPTLEDLRRLTGMNVFQISP